MMANPGKDMEKKEPLFAADESVNLCSQEEIGKEVPHKAAIRAVMSPTCSVGCVPEGLCYLLATWMYTVHSI